MHRWHVASLLLLSLAVPAAGQPAQGPWTLAEVRVEGASRYAVADVVRLSGLTTGETVFLDRLQRLTNDLSTTGLFREVGAAYATNADGGLIVTLRIEEPEWSIPLVYDNFIWMTDEEFTRAMAEQVPAFDGTAVEDGIANAFITAAAERVLAARGVRARVEFAARYALQAQAMTFALVARDTTENMRVCAVTFSGASGLPSRFFDDLAAPHVGRDYSRAALSQATDTLRQQYRQRGQWRAAIGEPAPSRVTGSCEGLTVTVPIDEGPPYDFAATRWIGVTVLATAELDRAINLRVGATADGRRLDQGLAAIERRYHERGYVAMTSGVNAEFDDAARRVTFIVEVREGPQFRMGTLSTDGIPERQAGDITRRWRLKAGDEFNGRYYLQFLREQSQRLGGGLNGKAELNHETATVDVTFSFGGQ